MIEKDEVTAKNRPEAIQMIKDHWQEVWNRYPDPEEKRRKSRRPATPLKKNSGEKG